MSYSKYTAEELQTLLKAIDSHLEKKVEIILIGGAAALLAYKATLLTHDVDLFDNFNALKKAYEKAKKDTGLDIPLSQAGVAEAPYNFEQRLTTYKEIELHKLVIKIPEVHDLILMKTIRGYTHDLEVIEEIVEKNAINPQVLIDRFETEMTHVTTHPQRLATAFAAVLARCFGDAVAEEWVKSRSTKTF